VQKLLCFAQKRKFKLMLRLWLQVTKTKNRRSIGGAKNARHENARNEYAGKKIMLSVVLSAERESLSC